MPFQKAEAVGPFDVLGDDSATTMRKVRSLNQHIDDVISAGENGDKLLHWATAIHGTPFQRCEGLLKQLLTEGGVDPNVRNAKGETSLLAAMRAGNRSALWELLQHGADASLARNSGQVPLHWLWTLPDYGPHSTEVDDQALQSFAACLSTGTCQSLLFKVVDAVADAVAARVNDSWKADQVIRLQAHMFSELPAGTPLHWAVKRRSIPTVKALIAVGASPSACAYGAQSTAGTGELQPLSAFHLAAAMHGDDILELFIQAEPSFLWNLDPCPLAVAIDGNVCNGYANGRIERMARHGPSCQSRAKETFKWFWDHNYRKLGKGFDKPVTGMTWKPNTPLTLAAQAGQVDVVEALPNTPFGRNLETKGGLGNHNPLQESTKRQCDEAYFLLRRYGSSVLSHTDLGDGGVESNLALLATSGHNRLDIAKDLIKAGVSVAAGKPLNKSPLLLALACGSFRLARLLLDHGADPNELRKCVGRFHGLDDTSIDAPSTLLGCLLLQFGHHQLLPLKWILDEHRAGHLTKPLQTTICPTTDFKVFHQLAFCPEVGRDDDSIISAFGELRRAFPDLSLLNGVATSLSRVAVRCFANAASVMATCTTTGWRNESRCYS
ncbi:ankyrin repeat-containing domain protein [Dactylonectria estremocensis]|uniref:Ankyrin repeat-containing domain protein n=1 Tax=Dactylonectria estremocensis TaxID=1079267 RepID=A0A9P9D406_9HYPO|nr:ankyrin repeat-containing domain protein [Dactylonectria estremocensis]